MTGDPSLRQTEAQRKTFYHRIEPVIVDLTEYIENTTIHGVKYLGKKERPFVEKFYWIVIFVVCFIFLGMFIHNILAKWEEHMVIVVEDDIPTPVYKIPFPAVTICPQTKVKVGEFSYERFNELEKKKKFNIHEFNQYLKKFELAQQICHYTVTQEFQNRMTEHFLNKSHIQLLYNISPSHFDTFDNITMPNSCRNYNSTIPVEIKNFSPILTNEGLCFTYNLPSEILRKESLQMDYPYYNISETIQGWNYDKGYTTNSTFPRRSCSAGEVSSLRIQLTSEMADLNSLCQPTRVGYKIILHSPAIYPTTFESYISVEHESLTKIAVKPRIITTSENLRSFTAEQRQCYFNDERKLQFFQFYNRVNCKLECFTNYTIKHYNCVHFAFPRGVGIPICGAQLNFLHIYEMVDSIDSLVNYLEDFPDDHDASELVENGGDVESFACDCLPACNSIEYAYSKRTEKFDFKTLHSAIENIWNDTELKIYVPATVEIYWKDPIVTGKTRKQYYTFSDLVSNFGGLLGLFMGASILSFFEVIYFCLLRQMTKCT